MNLNPLTPIYGAVMSTRNTLYDHHVLRTSALQAPVISVGNLSTGGSGKTPFVILLGELLKARGIRFDVLSRGYGRKTRGPLLVDPGGQPREFGDEPLLIVRRLNVPVVVGERRYEAGQLVEAKVGPEIHVLDDGFQHRRLARDFDIEPLRSLRRADAVVLTSGAAPEAFPLAGKIVWRLRRGIALQKTDPNIPARPLVFCGIARPQNFLLQLRAAGIDPAAQAFFRDHHAYMENDIRDLLQLKQRSDAGGFITTEKDAVNLGGYLTALAPLTVIPVKMELADAANAVDTMLRVIEERRRVREKMPQRATGRQSG
jgi:tetraacyldisaccharide 4'-kinase